MASFPERLKMLRERAGLTQQQLADKLEFSTGAVGNWESGLNMPSRAAMRKISGILGTTEMFLSGDSDIDSFTHTEVAPDYRGTLSFSQMTAQELEFIFDSRLKELAEARDQPQRRRELLGLVANLANELKKRIPLPTPTTPAPGERNEGSQIVRPRISPGEGKEAKPVAPKK